MSKLNNIDDAVRNSFENFEVPFDASQWSLLENQMDKVSGNELTSFDEKVKESVNGYEAAYNPAAWTAVESQLGSGFSYTKWIIAAGFVGLVSLGGWYLFSKNTDSANTETESTIKTEKVAVNKNGNNTVTKSNVNKGENNPESSQGVNSENVISDQNKSAVEEEVKSNNNIPGDIKPADQKTEPVINEIKKNDQPENTVPVIKKWNILQPQITGKTEICQGEKLEFESSSANEKVSVKWLLNGNEFSSKENITIENLMAGTHELELVHEAKAEFASTCTKSELRKTVQINVKENTIADFKFTQVGDAWYPETKFNILSTEKNTNYSWMIDNKIFTGEEVVYLFNKKGNYPVSLLAENHSGCTFTESKNIEISTDYNLLAPIAFTPNMDGLNDEFIPEALKYLNLPFKMNIYDRQQGLVFQSNRADFTWDGRNMNSGEACGQGAYLWVVELTNKNGEIEQYTGTITILK